MLKYIPMSDIWEIQADCVVVTVNCVGVMGAGLALECKQRYPDIYGSYRFLCNEGSVKPGKLYFMKRGDASGLVCLFPTKDDYKRDSTYGIIAAGLSTLKKQLESDMAKERIKTVVIPPLGCGLGKLDFSKVKDLYQQFLSELSQEILLIEP